MRALLILALLLPHISTAKEVKDGRFQIVNDGKFMIDTETGLIWQSICVSRTENGPCFTWWFQSNVEGIGLSSKDFWKKFDSFGPQK